MHGKIGYMKKERECKDKGLWFLYGVRILFYVVAIVLVIVVVVDKLGQGQTVEQIVSDYDVRCATPEEEGAQGFELANMVSGRVFVLGNGDVYYWPKKAVNGLGEMADQKIEAGKITGIANEMTFRGYKIATSGIVNATQLSFGLRYSGENLILIHGDGAVTWVNIYNNNAKLTELEGYDDIVSAAPSVNGDGVPVITLISQNGRQNHLLLNQLNALQAK